MVSVAALTDSGSPFPSDEEGGVRCGVDAAQFRVLLQLIRKVMPKGHKPGSALAELDEEHGLVKIDVVHTETQGFPEPETRAVQKQDQRPDCGSP